MTLGHGKVRETVGMSGTGISYTEAHDVQHHEKAPAGEQRGVSGTTVLFVCLVVLLVAYELVSLYAR